MEENMKKRFYSKCDLWLTLLAWGPMLFSFGLFVVEIIKGTEFFGIMAMFWILIIGFMGWLWFGTYYEFEDDYLLVRSGPIKEKYYYKDISDIKPSRAPWSSAALSLDRLALYNNGRVKGYISPKDKIGFVKMLSEKAPNIKIHL
jgi:hypothetical protein